MARWRGDGLAASLLSGGTGSLLATVAEVLLSLLLLVLLARSLGPDGLGIYAFVLALTSLISVPARMGLPELVVRETARGQTFGDWGHVVGLWRWAHRLILGISLLVALVLSVILLADLVPVESIRKPLLWGLLLVPSLALLSTKSAALRGLGNVLSGILIDVVLRPALLVLLVIAVVTLPAISLSPELVIKLTVVSALVAYAAGVTWLYRVRPSGVVDVKPQYDSRSWIAAAWPMALSQGFQQINRHTDLLLIGVLVSSPDVGVYRIAAQGALLVSLGLTALNMLVAPYIANLHARGEFDKLQKIARRTAQASLAFAVPAVLGFVISGEKLLITIFGEAFSAAWLPLLILGLGQIANAGFGSVGLLLNMTGHERDVLRMVAVAAVLNVLLNLILIPSFGVNGAAAATSISLVLWNVLLWRLVRRRLGIRCSAI